MRMRDRAVTGLLWTLLDRGGQQSILFVVFLIVARLIGPREFGLFSLSQVFPALATMLLIGLSDGVITRGIEDNRSLSTLFWSVTGIGLVLSVLGFLSAQLFADLFDEPALVAIIRWLSFVPVLAAISSVPTLLIQKHMDFKFFALRSLVSSSAGGVVGIWMAKSGYGALSIVAQMLVQQIVINIVIWPSSGWRPTFEFDVAAVRRLLLPGTNLSVSYILETADQQLPRFLIGMIFGPTVVGYYALVNRIWMVLREIFILPISLVFFPALAMLRTDYREKVTDVIRKVFLLIATIVTPAISAVIFLAPNVIEELFGNGWVEAGDMASAYLIGCYFLPFLVVIRTVCRVENTLTGYLFVQLTFLIASMLLFLAFSRFGITMAILASAATNLCASLFYMFLLGRLIDARPLDLARVARLPVLASIIMVGALLVVRFWSNAHGSWEPVFVTISSCAIGIVVYIGALCAFRFYRDPDVVSVIRPFLTRSV